MAALLAACAMPAAGPTVAPEGGEASGAAETAVYLTEHPQGTPPGFPTEVIEAVVGDPLVVGLLADLEARGLAPELSDASRVEVLADAPGQGYRLGEGWLHLHVYAEAQAAERAAARIRADGEVARVDWVGRPHFFRCDRLIALYLGADEGVMRALGEACALPFYTTPPADFGFRFEFSVCYLEVFDTFEQTFRREVEGYPAEMATVALSDDELRAVYAKLVAVDFFGYPATYAVATPESGAVAMVTPAYHFSLTVRDGGRTHTVDWQDEIVDPSPLEAMRLRELFVFIRELVKGQPEVQALPPAQVGCL